MLRFLIEKEFKQIFRNSFVPKILVVMPLMMMLIFPWAANQEIKNVKISVVDEDRSTLSERLVNKVTSSGYFILSDYSATSREAMSSIESCDADIILEIQNDFERNLIRDGVANVMIMANSINGIKGGLSSQYLVYIIQNYAAELRAENASSVNMQNIPIINLSSQFKFNPNLDYKFFMIPALLVMLITLLAGFLPALNIVSEKELGTIEQINVTPVKKIDFVLAKLIPYWSIGFVVLTFSMLLAWGVYGIYPVGNILTIYLFTSIYILVVSGMGLIISNYSNTMQQAMFVSFFFILIFLLMSGIFTPIISMPNWSKLITTINPLRYFIEVMRMVYMKGSAFSELWVQFAALCGFAVVLNAWAVLSYRKSH